jgi:hypothetical protein
MQQEIMRMETEFKDSLYIIASRMGENKPVEDALAHTRTFLPNSLIGERIFGRTVENISLLGMPLQQAVFDPTYGSLRDVPSAIIHTSMKLLVDSVSLGVNVAARTLISLSMQLSNSEKVTRMLTILVQDITSMMQTVSLFIAPVVLGVTTALQKVVMVTLTGIVQGGGQEAVSGAGGLSATSLPPGVELPGGLQNIVSGGGSAFGSVSPDVIAQMVTPAEFLIIIALYVIEVVIIMTYFTTKVEEDNPVLIRVNIAKAIPISMVVFLVAVIVSNLMIGSYMSAQ